MSRSALFDIPEDRPGLGPASREDVTDLSAFAPRPGRA